MINSDNPVAWSQLLYELEDAKEHLENLIASLQNDSAYDEEQFKVELGHVYAHLNRAWNTRNSESGATKENWEDMSMFPSNLKPVG